MKRSLIPVLERIVRVTTTQTRLAEPGRKDTHRSRRPVVGSGAVGVERFRLAVGGFAEPKRCEDPNPFALKGLASPT